MKAVHISCNISGGADIAARRLDEAMSGAGMDSHLLCREDLSISYGKTHFLRKCVNTFKRLCYAYRCSHIFSSYKVKGMWSDGSGLMSLCKHPLVQEADVVYLHWINLNSVSVEEIGRLLDSGKQVVWFMHDMWPITGGCHHSFECEAYQTHCNVCPMLTGKKKDLSYRVFERKLKVLKNRANLTVVSPSHWLAECAGKSSLFSNCRIEVIPNVIDTNKFAPFDRSLAKRILHLPEDKKIILFGCNSGSENFYKGWNYFEESLRKTDLSGCEIAVFGHKGKDNNKLPVNIHYLGRINDEYPGLVLAYSASDVFVSPSIAENFSLTLCESSSCGVPVVCFDVGGNSDIVLNRQTGYLARYRDSDDLAAGIRWVLNHPDPDELSVAARRHIEELCSHRVVLEKHKNLMDSFV